MQPRKIVSAAIVVGASSLISPACRRYADDVGRRGREATAGSARPLETVQYRRWHHGHRHHRWHHRRHPAQARLCSVGLPLAHDWWGHRQQSGTGQRCGRLLRATISLVRSGIGHLSGIRRLSTTLSMRNAPGLRTIVVGLLAGR